MDRKWNQFAERIPLSYPLEQELQRRYQHVIDTADDDEAIYFLPTHLAAPDEIIKHANVRFGERSMVSRVEGTSLDKERVLGTGFLESVEEDQREAVSNRGLPDGIVTAQELLRGGVSRSSDPSLPDGGLNQTEIRAWISAKAWGLDLLSQAKNRGLTFDPLTVKMEAFGGDWSYCGATYPIAIGRAMGLRNPIERRFDLMNPSEGPVLLQSEAVDQNIPMKDNIRLFIYEYRDSHGLRYLAQFFEGIRGIMDRAHKAVVELPHKDAHIVNLWGFPASRAIGIDEPPRRGPMQLSVGSGGQTPIPASIAMTRDELSLEEFRAALVSAQIRLV